MRLADAGVEMNATRLIIISVCVGLLTPLLALAAFARVAWAALRERLAAQFHP
jgi:hypothetical protein